MQVCELYICMVLLRWFALPRCESWPRVWSGDVYRVCLSWPLRVSRCSWLPSTQCPEPLSHIKVSVTVAQYMQTSLTLPTPLELL